MRHAVTGVARAGAQDPQPSPEAAPLRVGGDVEPPQKLHAPPPEYPAIARKAKIEGVVVVEVTIDDSGRVIATKVLKGLPMGLDQAAVDAVSRWTFEPATLDGKPVTVAYNLTVTFSLD